jgi:hypothetical protein
MNSGDYWDRGPAARLAEMEGLESAIGLCRENRWEYSSANTRLQIDRPKQMDA